MITKKPTHPSILLPTSITYYILFNTIDILITSCLFTIYISQVLFLFIYILVFDFIYRCSSIYTIYNIQYTLYTKSTTSILLRLPSYTFTTISLFIYIYIYVSLPNLFILFLHPFFLSLANLPLYSYLLFSFLILFSLSLHNLFYFY